MFLCSGKSIILYKKEKKLSAAKSSIVCSSYGGCLYLLFIFKIHYLDKYLMVLFHNIFILK